MFCSFQFRPTTATEGLSWIIQHIYIIYTHLEVYIVNHPEVQILAEVHHAELLCDVQLARPVEVQDTIECSRVPVKIILVFLERKCIAKIQYLQKISVYFSLWFVLHVTCCAVEAEASSPSLDLGCLASSLHMTSCLWPPMFSTTFSLSLRDLAISEQSGTLSPTW